MTQSDDAAGEEEKLLSAMQRVYYSIKAASADGYLQQQQEITYTDKTQMWEWSATKIC